MTISTGFFGRPEDTEPPIEGTQFTTNDLTTEERLAVEQMIDTVTTINTVTIPQINDDLDSIQAEIDGIDTKVAEAAASAASADASEAAAAASASAANVSATNALAAQNLAQTAATNAGTSAGAAASSATSAASSATSSAASAAAAAASDTSALAAKVASESARDASVAAKVASENARDASVVAKNAAQASATAAATSETNAAAYELSANNWATKTSGPVAGGEYSAKYHAQAAASSASGAASSASAASSSASTASAASTAAGAAQVAAETARDQTLAAYDNFDDRYLGPKTSDPTVDNDGNALIAGTLYFNSTLGYMKVYTGSVWVDAYAAGTSFLAKANNLSDLPSASTARTNLGLGTAATQNTAAFAAASHTHPISDVTNLQSSLDGKAALVHTHVAADITDSTTAGRSLLTGADAAAQRTSLGLGTAATQNSTAFAAASHTHAISDVTNLQTSLDAKLNTSATTYVQQSGVTGSAYLPAGTTAQRPASPAAGYIRYNSTTGKFEGYGSSWGNIGGGAAIGDTPPSNPGAGDLWWESDLGRLFVYYTDANSSQWVDTSAGGAGQYLSLTGGDVTGNVTVTGNFGVGTTSPTQVIDAYRASGVSAITARSAGATASDAGWLIAQGGSNTAYIRQQGDGNTFLVAPNNWQIYTNGAERARIDSSGNFLIGGTATNPVASRVNGIATGPVGFMTLRASNNLALGLSGSSGSHIAFYTDNGSAFVAAGNISSSGSSTAYNATSDVRLKTNITPVANSGQRIDAIEIVDFDWKTGGKGRGVIAQDVYTVDPLVVTVGTDETVPEDSFEFRPWSVDYSKFVPDLIACVQELRKEVKTLKDELAQLKGGE